MGILGLMALAVVLLGLLNLVIGTVEIPLRSVMRILFGEGAEEGEIRRNIILKSRLPQALTALMAGAGLSVSGLQMQTVFR
ncbi:MAG: iron ABC transporter permease, partial [Alistipes sp.]|nr:iron ABC transporter permease [Alistipes sp.]